ncbi:MAG: hypothetical protein NTY38_27325 [Acidobacteria bacterium]|nr:hypothetical protein [Acidobacteriota bacterium]
MPEYGAASFAIGCLELRQLLPSEERGRSDADGARGLLHVPLGEQSGNRILHLATEFCAVALHLQSPAIISL